MKRLTKNKINVERLRTEGIARKNSLPLTSGFPLSFISKPLCTGTDSNIVGREDKRHRSIPLGWLYRAAAPCDIEPRRESPRGANQVRIRRNNCEPIHDRAVNTAISP